MWCLPVGQAKSSATISVSSRSTRYALTPNLASLATKVCPLGRTSAVHRHNLPPWATFRIAVLLRAKHLIYYLITSAPSNPASSILSADISNMNSTKKLWVNQYIWTNNNNQVDSNLYNIWTRSTVWILSMILQINLTNRFTRLVEVQVSHQCVKGLFHHLAEDWTHPTLTRVAFISSKLQLLSLRQEPWIY